MCRMLISALLSVAVPVSPAAQAKRSSAVISKPKTNRKQAAWKARKGREKDMKVR